MTTVAVPHIASLSAGGTIVPASLNQDFFDTTSPNGIHSEPNGGMNSDNVSTSFEIQAEHVLEGEAVGGKTSGGVRKVDYMSDLFGEEGTNPTTATHVVVHKCAVRKYVPYNVSLLIWDVTFFRSIFRFKKITEGEVVTEHGVTTRVSVDGTAIPHTLRHHPNTAWPDTYPPSASPPGNNIESSFESYTADFLHVQHVQNNVSAGWHECTLELFMESTNDATSGSTQHLVKSMIDVEQADNAYSNAGVEVDLHNRITFGSRNASIWYIL